MWQHMDFNQNSSALYTASRTKDKGLIIFPKIAGFVKSLTLAVPCNFQHIDNGTTKVLQYAHFLEHLTIEILLPSTVDTSNAAVAAPPHASVQSRNFVNLHASLIRFAHVFTLLKSCSAAIAALEH